MNDKEKLKALSDLEGAVSDAVMGLVILNEIVEADTGRVFTQTKNGADYATLTISREEAERLSWLTGECLHRVRQLHRAYFAALDS